jgi:hypothetical protein
MSVSNHKTLCFLVLIKIYKWLEFSSCGTPTNSRDVLIKRAFFARAILAAVLGWMHDDILWEIPFARKSSKAVWIISIYGCLKDTT